MNISVSSKLGHPKDYRDDNYNYKHIPNTKFNYGKSTLVAFKIVKLTKELLLTPDLAFSMATYKQTPQKSKAGNSYLDRRRNNDSVISIGGWLCYDLDDPKHTIEEYKKTLAGYHYYILTSQNSTKEAPRYKLFIQTNLVFTSEENTLNRYKAAYDMIAQRLGIPEYDPLCTDLSRLIAPLNAPNQQQELVAYEEPKDA